MSWIVEKLAQRLQRFGAEPRPLLFREQRALEPYQSLFQERPESLQSRSKASRSERTKVLNLFSDIFKVIGQEAFLLCVLAGTITKWAKLDSEDAFFIIQKWWKTVTCPTGLTVVAREVCSQFSGSISPHSQASFNNTENHRDSDATIPLDQVPSSDAMSTGDDAGRIQFLPETPYERSDPETSVLTGKVYKLLPNDAKASVAEDSSPWLTVPYDTQASSFVTVVVSDKSARSLAQKRERLM